jgi:hypothetical protein
VRPRQGLSDRRSSPVITIVGPTTPCRRVLPPSSRMEQSMSTTYEQATSVALQPSTAVRPGDSLGDRLWVALHPDEQALRTPHRGLPGPALRRRGEKNRDVLHGDLDRHVGGVWRTVHRCWPWVGNPGVPSRFRWYRTSLSLSRVSMGATPSPDRDTFGYPPRFATCLASRQVTACSWRPARIAKCWLPTP